MSSLLCPDSRSMSSRSKPRRKPRRHRGHPRPRATSPPWTRNHRRLTTYPQSPHSPNQTVLLLPKSATTTSPLRQLSIFNKMINSARLTPQCRKTSKPSPITKKPPTTNSQLTVIPTVYIVVNKNDQKILLLGQHISSVLVLKVAPRFVPSHDVFPAVGSLRVRVADMSCCDPNILSKVATSFARRCITISRLKLWNHED